MPKLLLPLISRRRIRQIADMALALRESRGDRTADMAIYQAAGIADLASDPHYYAEAASYHLGLLFAHANEPEAAAEHFARSHTLPSTAGDILFPEHVRLGLSYHARQSAACGRGIPPILISAMPRSGSLSLSTTLAETLDIPIMSISKGRFPDYWIAPCWLAHLGRGGAVTHDHFSASSFNLTAIGAAGFQDVFVQVRDPRAAAASLVDHQESSFDLPRDGPARMPFAQSLVEQCIAGHYPWLEQWISVAEARGDAPRVHWILFDEVRRDLAATARRVLVTVRAADVAAVRTVTAHMVHGDDDAWRQRVDVPTRQRLWDAMPKRAIELLQLRP